MQQKIPPTDKVIILGNFNAEVGDYFTSWTIALGKFGSDKSNSNSEQLLSICTQFKLAITNTFFSKCLIPGTTLVNTPVQNTATY